MKQRAYHIGPGAPSLILILLLLTMTVLLALSLFTARADRDLSRRSVEAASEAYSRQNEAESRLAAADTALAAGVAPEDIDLAGVSVEDGALVVRSDARDDLRYEIFLALPGPGDAWRYRVKTRRLVDERAFEESQILDNVW